MSKKTAPFIVDSCKCMIDKLKHLGANHSIWNVFEDWLRISAISISNTVDWGNQTVREKDYLETIKKYTPKEQELLADLFKELIHSLENELTRNGPTDLLARVFRGLELHNKYHGQFFTPFHVCEFMGHISLGDGGEAGNRVGEALSEKGYISVCEPCVGSGGMVLGLANAMHSQKMNYCEQMVAYCCDIDIKCVHMAYLQLSLYGIPAVITHGNSLTLETWSTWYTPAYMLGLWPIKERAPTIEHMSEITKEKTPIAAPKEEITLVESKNGQLSLF